MHHLIEGQDQLADINTGITYHYYHINEHHQQRARRMSHVTVVAIT